MEAANCKVVCKVDYDYTSSEPITSSTAHYKIRDSSGSYIEYTKNPAPSNGNEVALEGIQSADQYELTLTLTVNGTTDQEIVNFQVDKCDLTSCKPPSIHNIYLGVDDQIIMDYTVDSNSFYAVEYQLAKDDQFTDIVHFRVVMENNYNPTEYIEMNDGTIEQGTVYHVRARKHCSTSEVSGWSNLVKFTSGKWNSQIPVEAYLLPGNYDRDPIICQTEDNWKGKVVLNTPAPQVGTLIYLSDGVTSAIPGNLTEFDSNPPVGFNSQGIRWIRFPVFDGSIVYDVNPQIGKIEGISGLTC